MSCVNCTSAIIQQQAMDEAIRAAARQKAKAEQRVVALYRNERGELCIVTGPGSYLIAEYISPFGADPAA